MLRRLTTLIFSTAFAVLFGCASYDDSKHIDNILDIPKHYNAAEFRKIEKTENLAFYLSCVTRSDEAKKIFKSFGYSGCEDVKQCIFGEPASYIREISDFRVKLTREEFEALDLHQVHIPKDVLGTSDHYQRYLIEFEESKKQDYAENKALDFYGSDYIFRPIYRAYFKQCRKVESQQEGLIKNYEGVKLYDYAYRKNLIPLSYIKEKIKSSNQYYWPIDELNRGDDVGFYNRGSRGYCQEVVNAITDDALQNVRDKKYETAIEDFFTGMKLARLCQNQANLPLDSFVSSWHDLEGRNMLKFFMYTLSSDLNLNQIEKIEKKFRALPPVNDLQACLSDYSLNFQLALGKAVLERFSGKREKRIKQAKNDFEALADYFVRFEENKCSQADVNDFLEMIKWYQSFYLKHKDEISHSRDYNFLKSKLSQHASVKDQLKTSFMNKRDMNANKQEMYEELCNALEIDAYAKIACKRLKLKTRLELIQIGLKIKKHYVKSGVALDSWDSLIENGYIKNSPSDPYSKDKKEPLKIQIESGIVTVWSCGEDGIDNNGNYAFGEGGDIFFDFRLWDEDNQ